MGQERGEEEIMRIIDPGTGNLVIDVVPDRGMLLLRREGQQVTVRLDEVQPLIDALEATGAMEGLAARPARCEGMATDSSDGDRRRYPRFRVPIYCQPAHLSRNQVVDIGLGGTRIHSDQPLTTGQCLDIELVLPDETRLACAARVAWLTSLPNGVPARYDAGLQFLEVPPGVLQSLADILENGAVMNQVLH